MNVRLIADGEAEACNRLFIDYYNKRRTMHQWRWEFVPTLYKCEQIPFAVVEDGGRIVGTQALMPTQMVDAAGVFWTAKAEEMLVDPAYRGKRLSVMMYELLFEHPEYRKFAYIWGFTRATKALRRVNFTVPAVVSQLFLPFSSRSIAVLLARGADETRRGLSQRVRGAAYRLGCGLAQLLSSLKIAWHRPADPGRVGLPDLRLRTLDEPPAEAGALCERFVKRWGGTTIYRDAEYLRWRLFENPYARSVFRGAYRGGRLLGWVAYALDDDDVGNIVDVMVAADPDQAHRADRIVRLLLGDAIIGLRNMGAVAVRAWRVNDHPFDQLITRVAKSIGFYHIRRGHDMVVYTTEAARHRPACDRLDNWFVTRIYTQGTLG